MPNNYIPEDIQELFTPGVNKSIQKATADCTHEELVNLVNNLVDVLNEILNDQKGE